VKNKKAIKINKKKTHNKDVLFEKSFQSSQQLTVWLLVRIARNNRYGLKESKAIVKHHREYFF
jgi:hypothetical protein